MTQRGSVLRYYAPRVLAALASILFTFALLELAARFRVGAVGSREHLVLAARKSWTKLEFNQHHSRLGWMPRPGVQAKGRDLRWRTKEGPVVPGTNEDADVNILDYGIRSNGQPVPSARHPRVLAVGDSFTFGDQVSDHQTWPAQLEVSLGVRVLNGGVYAYGIDQAVLRAELLAPIHRPQLVVLSFIPGDILRATVSVRNNAAKPYFEIERGRLILRNDPVPAPAQGLDPFRRIFGYSYLVDGIMNRMRPDYWQAGPRTRAHDRGAEVACLLMERLAKLGREQDLQVLVVAQQPRVNQFDSAMSDRLLGCARSAGLATLSLYPALQALADRLPERYAGFYFGHMTEAGNRFVAQKIAKRIRRRRLLAPAPGEPAP
ncbi:MAG: hypothetical protein JRH19_17495 [Deltaproteobacteria bacterium]|nr:hypothetical protein [Deltaproteobacteria bacterium]